MAEDNAPEFHDRFSIHPDSVEFCRGILMEMADSSRDEEEIEALSDWEAVQCVERLRKGVVECTKACQSLGRAARNAAANLSSLTEQLIPLAGHELAEETSLFLAIDHPA